MDGFAANLESVLALLGIFARVGGRTPADIQRRLGVIDGVIKHADLDALLDSDGGAIAPALLAVIDHEIAQSAVFIGDSMVSVLSRLVELESWSGETLAGHVKLVGSIMCVGRASSAATAPYPVGAAMATVVVPPPAAPRAEWAPAYLMLMATCIGLDVLRDADEALVNEVSAVLQHLSLIHI